MLLAASAWGLLVLTNAAGPLLGFALGLSRGGLHGVAWFQIGVILVVHGVALVPVLLLARAGIAGLQHRDDPARLVDLARLHARAWTWIAGIGAVGIGVIVLAVLVVGC